MNPRRSFALIGLAVSNAIPAFTVTAFEPIYERAPIRYHETEPDTKVTRLFRSAEENTFLSKGSDKEILRELLIRLDVPVESQVLVFSKTSAQNSRISPKTPRALYFSDDVYVGWVQGGNIELASFDARLGIVFHLLRLSGGGQSDSPQLVRDQSCLDCHAGSSNHNIPGLLVRSVYPSESGLPIFEAGTFHTRQNSPISERWGGWYVTGEVENQTHLGNALASIPNPDAGVALERFSSSDGGILRLDDLFDTEPYLNGGGSDVAALMILEHQVGVHNLLAEANLTFQTTSYRHREMQKAFGEPLDAPLSETNERILDSMAEKVLHEMLYANEVEVPAGIEGGAPFQTAFAEKSKKSQEGHSLRDFRLYGRLMKHRCSHLIYSDAFRELPKEMRERILDKLHQILTEPALWPEFAHLGNAERSRIREIVMDTLPNLPPSWTP